MTSKKRYGHPPLCLRFQPETRHRLLAAARTNGVTCSTLIRKLGHDRAVAILSYPLSVIPLKGENPGGRKTSAQVCVRIEEAESILFERMAKADDMKVSPWLRALVVQYLELRESL